MLMHRGADKRKLPFALNRASVETLTNQLVEGVKKAIDDGVYAEGDRLPTWEQLAVELGVSTRIPREAMRRLSEDGYVVARPRLGCRVLKPNGRKKEWKGVVLLVTTAEDDLSYSHVAFARELRMGLFRAGYQLIVSTLRDVRRRVYDFDSVTSVLRFKIDLAVVANNKTAVYRRFSEFGVPFLVMGKTTDFPHCLGSLTDSDAQDAIDELVAHCQRAGVRTVLQVGFCTPSALDASVALAAVGMTVERWTVPPAETGSRMESIRSAAFSAFCQRFGASRASLPDLILFVDDYVASGGIFALAALGIRIPDEVRIVTFANEGNLPLAGGLRLACILNRPGVMGARAAHRIVSMLSRRTERPSDERVCVYRAGDSFPES